MKRELIVAAVALAVTTGAAFAAGPGKGPGGGASGARGMFERADANDDGMLTREEVDAVIARRSGEYDTDGDGALSAEEFIAGMQREREQRLRRHFERMDSDGDGELSATEMQAPAVRLFAHADRNGDGILTKDELPRHGKGDHNRRRHED